MNKLFPLRFWLHGAVLLASFSVAAGKDDNKQIIFAMKHVSPPLLFVFLFFWLTTGLHDTAPPDA